MYEEYDKYDEAAAADEEAYQATYDYEVPDRPVDKPTRTIYICEKCNKVMEGPGSYDGEYSSDPVHQNIGLCNECIRRSIDGKTD